MADTNPATLGEEGIPQPHCFYDQAALSMASNCYALDMKSYIQAGGSPLSFNQTAC